MLALFSKLTKTGVIAWLTASCSFGFQLLDESKNESDGENSGGEGGLTADLTDSSDEASGGNVTSPGPHASGGQSATDVTTSDGLGGSPDSIGPDPIVHCDTIAPLTNAPLLDGQPEPGMYLEAVQPVGWRHADPLPEDHQMFYSVGWRPNGLYFFIEVIDPDRNPAPSGEDSWKGDAVEIFVDHDGNFETAAPFFDDVGTRQFIIAAPADDGSPSERAQKRIPIGYYSNWNGDWIGVATSTGYIIEAFIDASSLDLSDWSLQPGQRVGIDLAHDISVPPGETGTDGNRLGQYFLKIEEPETGSETDLPWQSESVFCLSTLVDAN